MYPLGKMMQLKLELFFDNTPIYKANGDLDQEAMQTGEPRGKFKRGNPHPTVEGLFYKYWGNGKECWGTKEQVNRVKSKAAEWFKNNPETVKQSQAKIRNTERYKEKVATWHKENPEARRKHRDKWTSSKKGQRWEKKHRKEALSKYWKSNRGREVSRIKSGLRRARKVEASDGLTEQEYGKIQQIYKHCARVSKKLKIPFHVDHIIPLSKGGLHHPLNLQVVPAKWNLRKNNNNTERWLPNGM